MSTLRLTVIVKQNWRSLKQQQLAATTSYQLFRISQEGQTSLVTALGDGCSQKCLAGSLDLSEPKYEKFILNNIFISYREKQIFGMYEEGIAKHE